MNRIVLGVLAGVCLVLSGTAAASDINWHRQLTQEALSDLGWTDGDMVAAAADAAVATDVARLPALSRMTVGVLMPAVHAQVPGVAVMAETAPFSYPASTGFHFNGLFSFDAIDAQWTALQVWVDGTAADIARGSRDRRDQDYVTLVGIVSHAVTDFYEHANWISILNGYTPGDLEPEEFPLWEELIHDAGDWAARNPLVDGSAAVHRMRLSNVAVSATPELGGLQTGRLYREAAPGDPWTHRHHLHDEALVLHHLAVRAIQDWTRYIDLRMADADRLMAAGQRVE